MRAQEHLIAFFDSREAALQGLLLIAPPNHGHPRGTQAVLVSREPDGSRTPIEASTARPICGIIGAGLGGLVGSLAGEAGAVVGLFFGLYVGFFLDVWRTLARANVLDRVQDGLGPGQAAVVAPVRPSSAASIERRLAGTEAVIVHRFPGKPIEDDLAREVDATVAALGRLGTADEASDDGLSGRAQRIEAARRRLSVLESFADRLTWLERMQFTADTRLLTRELRESPRWRAPRLRRRAARSRASHRRAMTVLEGSSARLRAAAATVEATSR